MVYISIRKIISIYSVGKWVNVKMGIWEYGKIGRWEKAYFIDKMITAKILSQIGATSPQNATMYLKHLSHVKHGKIKNKYPEWENGKIGRWEYYFYCRKT
jgi:hypothetical protein